MGSTYKPGPLKLAGTAISLIAAAAVTATILFPSGNGIPSIGAEFDSAVPIGTVIAFAGNPALVPAGWELCDGRSVDTSVDQGKYRALFEVIGTSHGAGFENGVRTGEFNLPDYRGLFLRGVSQYADYGRDPDRDNRMAANIGGNEGNMVGSLQNFATSIPMSEPFHTSENGNHSHASSQFDKLLSLDGTGTSDMQDDSPSEPNVRTCAPMQQAGVHGHIIAGGGDQETRPINAYVNWLIKI